MSNRLVVVDDTDPNIQYSGPWFTAQNSQLTTGNFGPPFQSTLHGVSNNASFSYSFSGSQPTVLGTSITTNASGTQDPTWECFIDNISIGWNFSPGSENENNWVICQNDQLLDGPHVLSMNVTVLHQQTFWFDQIQYLPSSDVTLYNSTLRVDSSDPAVQYSSGWTELLDIVNLTQSTGSTVTFQFFGVSLSWFGLILSNFPLTSTSAIYSIDNQTPIPFSVPALKDAKALRLYNQVLFKTETLSPGQHELIVTYQGNSRTAPLALDYFVVQNASATSALTSVPGATSAISTSATSSSVPSSSSSNSTSSPGSKKLPLVGIVVGVVGGVIVLVLLLLLYNRGRNIWRAQKSKAKLDTKPEPFNLVYNSEIPPQKSNTIPEPFNQSPSVTPQSFSSKFSRRTESASTPGSSIPTTSPVIGAQIDPINLAIRSTETIPLMPPSTSAQDEGGDLLLQHSDSGVRMPRAQGRLVELPPVYTN